MVAALVSRRAGLVLACAGLSVAGLLAAAAPAEGAAGPSVTALSSTTGPARGGTYVTVTGTGFTKTTSVRFGAHAATKVTVASTTRLTATAPAGSGLVDVQVVTAAGTSAPVSADHYLYGGPRLIAKYLDPSSTAFTVTSIACPAAGRCVAVGYEGNSWFGVDTPLAFVQNGTAWKRIAIPLPSGTAGATVEWLACASVHECYAAGVAQHYDRTTGHYSAVDFLVRVRDGAVTTTTLGGGSATYYGPIGCAGPGTCLLTASRGTKVAFYPLGTTVGRPQVGAPLPRPQGRLASVRCRAAGSCVVWGQVSTGSSDVTAAFAEVSIGGAWQGATIAPLAGDQGASLSEVVCDTATTCTGYGASEPGAGRSDRPFRASLRADGSLDVAEVPVTPAAASASDRQFDDVSCSTPTVCISQAVLAGSTPEQAAVYRLVGGGWHATPAAAAGVDQATGSGTVQCRADGQCAATGSRYVSTGSSNPYDQYVTRPVGYFPLGSGYAQVDLPSPSDVHRVAPTDLTACAPTGNYCATILAKVFGQGLGGTSSQDYVVLVSS